MPSLKTRIFKNGNSQAVRIPQQFRLDTAQVEISRNGNGDLVILTPYLSTVARRF